MESCRHGGLRPDARRACSQPADPPAVHPSLGTATREGDRCAAGLKRGSSNPASLYSPGGRAGGDGAGSRSFRPRLADGSQAWRVLEDTGEINCPLIEGRICQHNAVNSAQGQSRPAHWIRTAFAELGDGGALGRGTGCTERHAERITVTAGRGEGRSRPGGRSQVPHTRCAPGDTSHPMSSGGGPRGRSTSGLVPASSSHAAPWASSRPRTSALLTVPMSLRVQSLSPLRVPVARAHSSQHPPC